MSMPVTSASAPITPAASTAPRALPKMFAALAAGTLFGFGLSYSGMIRPQIVLSFLRWQDVGLMFVLGGAVIVTFIAYRFAPRVWSRPLLGGNFGTHESLARPSTIVGAALFGIGWGLSGVCPGPSIAGLGAGSYELLYAIAGMALGALAQGLFTRDERTS